MNVLITGASSGIGRELARLLAPRCRQLVLVGRNTRRLETLKTELSSYPSLQVSVVVADISNKDACLSLHNEYPDIDFLINNAGFGDFGEFCETDLDKELQMIDTNIKGLHTLMKLYLPDMVKRDHGRILNVASIAGFMPGPLMATYYATKNYVVRLSEAIYEELRRDKSKVKISILCPGPVDTNFNQVANVSFALKGLKSMDVAKYAIHHLNRFYIVPGFSIRMARVFSRFLPSLSLAKMVYGVQRDKIVEKCDKR